MGVRVDMRKFLAYYLPKFVGKAQGPTLLIPAIALVPAAVDLP